MKIKDKIKKAAEELGMTEEAVEEAMDILRDLDLVDDEGNLTVDTDVEVTERERDIAEFFENLILLFNAYDVAASFDFYWDDRDEDGDVIKLKAHANISSTYFRPDGSLKYGQGILH